MQQITVKKCPAHRTGIKWFCYICWVLSGVLMGLVQDWKIYLVIISLIMFPTFLMHIYFDTWTIDFSAGAIIRRRWGTEQSYGWKDVQQVTSNFSPTEGPYIRIRFRDGRVFQFRMVDENAAEAKKMLLKHTSIKTM